jgi:organic hydroperoxide reductase OsmC/OhrA
VSATEASRAAVRVNEFHFPVVAEWTGGRRVSAEVEGKPSIEIAPPLVFRGDDPSAWSPEDFLVASAASCLGITFTGLAQRAGLEYSRLTVAGDGACGQRPDGRFGFTRLSLRLELETLGDPAGARELAERAEETCLVAASLDVPIETTIVVNGR